MLAPGVREGLVKPLPEWLDDELERQRSRRAYDSRQPVRSRASDPQVDALVHLARRFQSAPPLQVDPHFARRLEDRVLARHEALQRHRSLPRRWGWRFPGSLRAHPALGVALSLMLLVILLGTGVLVAAAQVADPANPLYAIKRWERQAQTSLFGTPADQAELDLQLARDRLDSLSNLANTAHAGAYGQALNALDQQLGVAAQDVNVLPAGADRTRLSGELASLRADARRTLRGLLLRLAVPERLATTAELGRLGDTIPQLTQADLTLPTQPNGQATIRLSGAGFLVGAQLLVDSKLVVASGALQQGVYLFTTIWMGNLHPHSIGLMNPDGTVAQTAAITLHTAAGSGNGGGNGGGTGNGGGSGNGGSNGGGNGRGNGNGGSNGGGGADGQVRL